MELVYRLFVPLRGQFMLFSVWEGTNCTDHGDWLVYLLDAENKSNDCRLNTMLEF